MRWIKQIDSCSHSKLSWCDRGWCDPVHLHPHLELTNYIHNQGRIKVRGGPRLDTVMGPYHLSSSSTRTEGLLCCVHLWVLHSKVRWAPQMEYNQKDVNRGTGNIVGVTRIWCEEARNEASTAKRPRRRDRATGVLLGGQSDHGH